MTRLRRWLRAWLYLDPDLIEDIGNCPEPTTERPSS
jgi:hypothetical protein